MKVIHEILIESSKKAVEDARRHLDQAIKYDNSRAGGPSSREEVHRARERLAHVTQELKRNTGEVKTAKFVIPADRATDVHMHLHSMWKNTPAGRIPWGNFYHEDKDKTVVSFHDYTPGATSGAEGGATVEELIKYVKSHSI